MKRYLIEREITGAGGASPAEHCAAARAANQAVINIGPRIQWQHTYVAAQKTFCIYLAESEADIIKHGELSGMPVSKITEIVQVNDPLTANV
jgi:hypothetical protein